MNDFISKEQICGIYTCTIIVINKHIKNKTFPLPKYIVQKSGGKLNLYHSEDVKEWARQYGYLKTFDNLLAIEFVRGWRRA